MSITIRNIKKWTKMLLGKSIDHVHQGIGKSFSVDSVKGYYNDLTQKVLKDKKHYYSDTVFAFHKNGKDVFPAIEMFQYGLGVYDLLLQGVDSDLMERKFISYLEWGIKNQNKDGSWDAFSFRFEDNIYSAMAQGEGASFLIRGYEKTKNDVYLKAAKKAIDYMIKPVNSGGTSSTINDNLCLLEYTHKPYVFNGWIFASFGLLDYYKVTGDTKYKEAFDSTIKCLLSVITKMDNGYWSMYDGDKIIASPFYHELHIALLSVLYSITGINDFEMYAKKFQKYRKNPIYRFKSFVVKAFQKARSKD